MTQQRSNACSRLHQAGPLILDCPNDLFNDKKCRSEAFKSEIGFAVQDGKHFYRTLAPILYSNDADQTDQKWTIFRNPMLMKVSVTSFLMRVWWSLHWL